MSSESAISAYYANKNVFITGATGKTKKFPYRRLKFVCHNAKKLFPGFMGKVLVEKLLRDCEELSTIFILVRTKKGQQPHERYENYISHIGEL